MARVLVVGGTGRLGKAVAERYRARGDEVFCTGRQITTLPEDVNYVVFCQRYRGDDALCGDWLASIMLTDRILSQVGFSDGTNLGVVIVSSIAGYRADTEHTAAYQCAKAAQIHLAKHWALRYPHIPMTTVCPMAFTGKTPVLTMDEVADQIVAICGLSNPGAQPVVIFPRMPLCKDHRHGCHGISGGLVCRDRCDRLHQLSTFVNHGAH